MFNVALLLLRVVLGMFFVLARFRFFYDPSRPEDRWFNHARHVHLTEKLTYCGLHFEPSALSWFVASVEVFGGLAVTFGILSRLATFGLLCLLIVATMCTARTKVGEQNPVDKVDDVSDYLWRVEGVYITICLSLLLAGPGSLVLVN